MQRRWMTRVLVLALMLAAIPLAVGGPAALQAGGSGGASGSAYAWGYNNSGQLGDGSTTNRSVPVAVSLPAGVTISAMAAGFEHSLAIGPGAKIAAWGDNFYGQLGTGDTNSSSVPLSVSLPGGVTATAIAAGHYHSLAIGSDGNAYAWGYNAYGQLGSGIATDSSVPVAVGVPVRVTAIAAGFSHSLAIESDGNTYAWGNNGTGQLGINSTTESHVPVVVHLPAFVTPTAIAAGFYHSLAIGSDGKLYAWGNNGNGQLGNNSTTESHVPVTVSLPAGVKPIAIAAGGSHSLAIGSNGKLYAWGSNVFGQLGNTTTTPSLVPVTVSLPPGTTPLALGAGSSANHSLAILVSGSPTAALVAHFRVAHTAHGVVFRWRVASTTGILGFSLTAGTRQLNRTLIPVHVNQNYRYASRASGSLGRYVLHVVLRSGGSIAVAGS